MNHHYLRVIGCFLLSFTGYSISISQSIGPEFLQCSSIPDSLCVQTEGVRLPANNQLYLGEAHPDATSCSVHVTQKKFVLSTCGGPLQYEVQLFLNDTSSVYILKPLTTITADSNGMAELYFDTEESPDAQISTSGIPYTTGCMRYHRIKWIVTDTCGTESVCEQLIDLYDCKAPLVSNEPQQLFIVLIGVGGFGHIYAKDLIAGILDDCTDDGNFLFSLKKNEYDPDSLIFCEQVPAYGVELLNKVWIADDGRDLNCDGTNDWDERNIYEQDILIVYTENVSIGCGVDPAPLSGYIKDRGQYGIENAIVSLEAQGHIFPTYQTGSDGIYYFNNIFIIVPLTIRPKKDDNHKNGVSTLDLIKIQKHLLGKEIFDDPYLLIAADANNSQNASAIDLIELRKLILGIYTELPHNESWRFIRKDYIFGDTMNPWPIVDKEIITITDSNNPGNTDFVGIKIGDVNGTAQPHFGSIISRESLKPFNLLSDQVAFNKEQIINVPIRISTSQTLTGFQFTLSTNGMEIQDVIPGRIQLTDGEYALFGDKMTISWFDENLDVAADEVLFTLVMRAKHAGNISQTIRINSDITDAEIYLDDEQTFVPVLNVVNPIAEAELAIVSCAPNPWKDETTIFFYLQEASNVTYNLIDVNGRRVYSHNEYVRKGYHSYVLKASDFSAKGMLFLEIGAGRNTVVQKTVLME